ncbi:hypothetical protein EOS_35600 [Caballeronia mineralivorans PML1(12)]|uniref:Uncharacterized protein n=1 Tax=Caballeronia mineralivorans PML1(12) TaxID=908627 RepID=A0A0J1CLV5_9BURK|nr:hypothetical protein EOS_35600 [Caballeronia mineralivorans PML1(12)]
MRAMLDSGGPIAGHLVLDCGPVHVQASAWSHSLCEVLSPGAQTDCASNVAKRDIAANRKLLVIFEGCGLASNLSLSFTGVQRPIQVLQQFS